MAKCLRVCKGQSQWRYCNDPADVGRAVMAASKERLQPKPVPKVRRRRRARVHAPAVAGPGPDFGAVPASGAMHHALQRGTVGPGSYHTTVDCAAVPIRDHGNSTGSGCDWDLSPVFGWPAGLPTATESCPFGRLSPATDSEMIGEDDLGMPPEIVLDLVTELLSGTRQSWKPHCHKASELSGLSKRLQLAPLPCCRPAGVISVELGAAESPAGSIDQRLVMQDLDVITAVRDVCSGQATHVAKTLAMNFQSDFSRDGIPLTTPNGIQIQRLFFSQFTHGTDRQMV